MVFDGSAAKMGDQAVRTKAHPNTTAIFLLMVDPTGCSFPTTRHQLAFGRCRRCSQDDALPLIHDRRCRKLQETVVPLLKVSVRRMLRHVHDDEFTFRHDPETGGEEAAERVAAFQTLGVW